MTKHKNRTSQAQRQVNATKDPLELKKNVPCSKPVEVPKERDSQDLGNGDVSTGSLQSDKDSLNLDLAPFTDSVVTEDKLPEPHTDELRHTDELCFTDDAHARTDKLDKKKLRSHGRSKLAQEPDQ